MAGQMTSFSPQAPGGSMSDKDGAIGRDVGQLIDTHASQRSDAMLLLPKWVRWAGLGLCASMVPAMAVAARPASHKVNKTSTASAVSPAKSSKSSKTATAHKLNASSKKAHAHKLSTHAKTHKSHKALTHKHTSKKATAAGGATKLSKQSKK